jgi:hypothetical protein
LEADVNGVLASKLTADVEGLEQLLAKNDAETALHAMIGKLQHATIIGKSAGSITSWSYFQRTISEEVAYRDVRSGTRKRP